MKRLQVRTIAGSSPASAATAAVGSAVVGLEQFDWFQVVATLIGSTNGTVDACLQFRTDEDTDEWWDWIRFPQVAAGATVKYQVTADGTNTITAVGSCTTASPAVTLAANTSIGGHPGNSVRLVVTAGAGTDSAATQTVKLRCWRARHS